MPRLKQPAVQYVLALDDKTKRPFKGHLIDKEAKRRENRRLFSISVNQRDSR